MILLKTQKYWRILRLTCLVTIKIYHRMLLIILSQKVERIEENKDLDQQNLLR